MLEQESKNMKDAWILRAQRDKEEEKRREAMKKRMLMEKKGNINPVYYYTNM